MSNHTHFLMKSEDSDDSITHLMHALQTSYALTEKERQRHYRDYVQTLRPYESIVDRYFEERVLL
jgi:hypothetical protein